MDNPILKNELNYRNSQFSEKVWKHFSRNVLEISFRLPLVFKV
jgi:hypothetical protein